MNLKDTDPVPLGGLSTVGLFTYFWGTDFAFCYPEILVPIINKTFSSDFWYSINTGILTLAHESIIATGYLSGKKRKNGSLKKGLALTTASFVTNLLSYTTITQALVYEKTGNLGGLAGLVTELHLVSNHIGLSTQRSFDVWNLSAIAMTLGFFGLYFGVRELAGYMQQKAEQE